jgi:hypothetical protein
MNRNWFTCIATAIAVLACAGGARAQSSLAYDFETIVDPNGPDGFFGLGAAVSQDTIGATHGDFSMKYDVGVGGFVGARTEAVIPAALNDPPGVKYVLFDATLTEAYTDTFANVGVTVFGHALNAEGGPQFGHQVQFLDEAALGPLGAGTHTDLRIDLDFSLGPYRPGESFNDIFGPGASDLTVASAFQLFISKNVLTPITVYIDNVRLVVPEPATGMLLSLGATAIGLVARRRR